tara:strand:- start:1504 stop:1698 length:195 start_codon:yes stop_codon:yes gene_type:complete
MKIDYNKIKVLEVDNINHYDYPEYSDAYISEANYDDKPMSDEMLDEINDNHPDFVHQQVWAFMF